MGGAVWAEFNSAAGRLKRCAVAEVRGEALEWREPVWRPVQYRGKRSIATWWRLADVPRHAGCANLGVWRAAQELDFDPSVATFASWPVRLGSPDNGCVAVPDFFARLRSGEGCLVVCLSDAQQVQGGTWQERMRLLQTAAGETGWQLRVVSGAHPVVEANRRRLSRYRHARWADERTTRILHEVFARPLPFAEGIASSGLPRLEAAGRAHHLIWTQELVIDWERLFAPVDSLVVSARSVAA
ncbi:hypothetical protein ACIRUY_17225 [Streptomyces erythrochromogenes]|uniref:hypothetical protein n=1 Tax=Streptomyces erythrochromogenes TaxID=285574 RepID=UPI00382A4450|nr:hypothetical protein OG364_00815 [Streptomyces erythrochromogenes]WST98385.1 hypothetical protein OG364_40720 [Streptomyces erythrochromogenes]